MTRLEPSRIQQARDVFDEAVRLKAAEREAFVRSRLSDRPELLHEILRMLPYIESEEQDGAWSGRPEMPACIGRFRVTGRAPESGACDVYEAWDGTGRVALKVVPAGAAGRAGRLRREAQLLRKVEGPGFARLVEHGVAETPDGPRVEYLALEWVEGERLDAWARGRERDVRDIAGLLATLCERIGTAHRRGVAHGDLKPDNIIVGHDGLPVVLDLGAADSPEMNDGERPGGAGTPAYLAPERRRRLGRPTASSDVFALGVIAYRLIAGVHPGCATDAGVWSGGGAPALSGPAPEARGDLERIVHRALHEDRRARYATAGRMAGDLRRYLAGRPIEPQRSPFLSDLLVLVKRHPTSSAALAGLAVLLALAGVMLWRQSERTLAAQAQAIQARDRLLELAAASSAQTSELMRVSPGQAEARLQAAARAMSILESLAADAGNDPALRLLIAEARIQQAVSLGLGWGPNLGRLDEALRELERAIAELRALPGPPDDRARFALARALMLRWSAKPDQDEQGNPLTADLDESGPMLEALLARRPGDLAVRETLAEWLLLSAMHRWRRDSPDTSAALGMIARGEALLRGGEPGGGPAPGLEEILARLLRHRSIVLRESGDTRAAAHAAEAWRIIEPLADAARSSSWLNLQATQVEMELSLALAAVDPALAEHHASRALARLDRVHETDPTNFPVRRAHAVQPAQGARAMLDAAHADGLSPQARRGLLAVAERWARLSLGRIEMLRDEGRLMPWEKHYADSVRRTLERIEQARRTTP